PNKRAREAATATHLNGLRRCFVGEFPKFGFFGGFGLFKAQSWFLDKRLASKRSKSCSSPLVIVPSRYFCINPLISFSVIGRSLYLEVPKRRCNAHWMAQF